MPSPTLNLHYLDYLVGEGRITALQREQIARGHLPPERLLQLGLLLPSEFTALTDIFVLVSATLPTPTMISTKLGGLGQDLSLVSSGLVLASPSDKTGVIAPRSLVGSDLPPVSNVKGTYANPGSVTVDDRGRITAIAAGATATPSAGVLASGVIDNGITSTFYFKRGNGYSFSVLAFYHHSPEIHSKFGATRVAECSSAHVLETGASFDLTLYRFIGGAGSWQLVGTAAMVVGQRAVKLPFTAEVGYDYSLGFSYDGADMLSANGAIL